MNSNWHHDFFRGVALDMWRMAIPPERTRAEVDFLLKFLGAPEGSRWLDVPCGLGRHSIELARRGCIVTGVDASEEAIAEARSHSEGLNATWIVADMRELPWIREFDGALCFGNSFGYLDAAGAGVFLSAVAHALKPGAPFALETGMAAESILPTLQSRGWYKDGDIYMLSERRYHPREGRLDIDYTFIREGVVDTRPSSSYVLTVNEICRLHQEAEMEPFELLCSIEGGPYQLGSPRLIVVSEKLHR